MLCPTSLIFSIMGKYKIGQGESGTSGGNVAFNGERPIKRVPTNGLNPGGLTVSEFLENLFFPFVAATIGLSNILLREKGTIVTLNLTATITANDETIFSNGRLLNGANTQVGTFNAAPGNQAVTPIGGLTQNDTFRALVDIDNNGNPITIQASRVLSFEAPTYAGAGPLGLNESQIKNLTKFVRARANHTVAFSPTNQRFYYAYPATFGLLARIIDPNNFDVTASFQSVTEIFTLADGNQELYRIYFNNADTTQTNFNLRFEF